MCPWGSRNASAPVGAPAGEDPEPASSIAGVRKAEMSTTTRRRPGTSGGGGGRLRSLDGLRGVAAAVVVVHHALLMLPTLSDAYKVEGGPVDPALPAWALTYTPLHLLWSGGEAVIVFFVLSGLVVTLPALRAGFSWPAYYPKRILRLYLPIVAGVTFAALTLLMVPRHLDEEFSGWVNSRARAYTPGTFLQDLWLLDGASGVVSPLWSLNWEIRFSLLLPLYVVGAVLARRHIILTALAAGGLVALALVGDRGMFYLSVFGFGALLAASWPRLVSALGDAGSRSVPRTAWRVALATALVLLVVRWLVPATPRGPFPVTVEPCLETVVGAAADPVRSVFRAGEEGARGAGRTVARPHVVQPLPHPRTGPARRAVPDAASLAPSRHGARHLDVRRRRRPLHPLGGDAEPPPRSGRRGPSRGLGSPTGFAHLGGDGVGAGCVAGAKKCRRFGRASAASTRARLEWRAGALTRGPRRLTALMPAHRAAVRPPAAFSLTPLGVLSSGQRMRV